MAKLHSVWSSVVRLIGAHRDAACVASLVGLVVLYFAPLLSATAVVDGDDTLLALFPYRDLINSWLQSGEINFWNPYSFGGMPFYTTPTGQFTPTHYLFGWFSPSLTLGLDVVFHASMTAAFTFLFCRRLGLGRIASYAGAVALALSSVSLLQLSVGHLPRLQCQAYYPVLLYCWESFRQNGRWRYVVGTGVAMALSVQTAHIQMVYYGLGMLVVYAVWSACQAKSASARWRLLAAFFAASIIGVLLSAPFLFPVLAWSEHAARSGSVELALQYEMHLTSAWTVLAPDLFGYSSEFWGPGGDGEANLFLGCLTVPLALAALMRSERRGVTLLFFGLAALGILFALGDQTPLFRLCYDYVPGYRFFRVPPRSLSVFAFAFSLLLAFGVDTLLHASGEKRSRILVVLPSAVAALALLIAALSWLPDNATSTEWTDYVAESVANNERNYRLPTPPSARQERFAELYASAAQHLKRPVLFLTLGFLCLAAFPFLGSDRARRGLVFLALATLLVDVWTAGRDHLATVPVDEQVFPPVLVDHLAAPTPPYRVAFARTGVEQNRALRHRLRSVEGYDGTSLHRFNRLINTITGHAPDEYHASVALYQAPHADTVLLDLFNVRYVLAPVAHYRKHLAPSDFRPVKVGDHHVLVEHDTERAALFEYQNAPGYAWMVYSARRVQEDEALRALVAREIPLAQEVIFDGDAPTQLLQTAPPGKHSVQVIASEPDNLHLVVQTDRPGYLVLSEAFFPGWEASLDGEAVEIYQGNYLLRVVEVPGGTHDVKMTFRPPHLRVGLLCAGSTTLFLFALAVWRRRTKKTG